MIWAGNFVYPIYHDVRCPAGEALHSFKWEVQPIQTATFRLNRVVFTCGKFPALSVIDVEARRRVYRADSARSLSTGAETMSQLSLSTMWIAVTQATQQVS